MKISSRITYILIVISVLMIGASLVQASSAQDSPTTFTNSFMSSVVGYPNVFNSASASQFMLLETTPEPDRDIGECDGTIGDDTIDCNTTPITPYTHIEADLGDDTITIGSGVTLSNVYADGIPGSDYFRNHFGDDDTVINNGTVSTIMGDNIYDGSGGNDNITNNGTTALIWGDGINGNGNGGDDTITNSVTGDVEAIYGDRIDLADNATSVFGGNDTIINDGVASRVTGDYMYLHSGINPIAYGGHDLIINNGTIDYFYDQVPGGLYGDYLLGDNHTNIPGQDTIINNGLLDGSIFGDYVNTNVEDSMLLGASDVIVNTGTITGTIFGNGGDDHVILQDGASGGDDNNLPLDGGDGFDTLYFAFTGLDQSTIDAINASNPANDSITIDGETFTWTNFEAFGFDDLCPDGTAGDDTIVCLVDPPIGTNTDVILEGGAGIDHITINAGVSVNDVLGDRLPFPDANFDDVIINHGTVNRIEGDFIGGDGGDDTITITSTGWVSSVIGDNSGGDGGDDQLTNSGTAIDLTGDGNSDSNGGNDTILNEVDGESFFLFGDLLSADQDDITLTGGQDSITNHGDTMLIMGDDLHQSPETSNVTLIGNDDTILNTGEAEEIFGDYIHYDDANSTAIAGQDTITNTGVVRQSIYGDGLGTEFSEVDNSEALIGTGEGASDTITNSGTVGGTIFAEGGDDTVILRDGANGGDDNNLPLDGGDGTDTLIFEFSNLDQSTIDAINALDPANDSITIDSETFTWTNFETLTAPALICPDGTAGDDTIVCQTDPPIGTNTDESLSGYAGEDHITINAGVTLRHVIGEGGGFVGDGFSDVIVNHGNVWEIHGDLVTGDGGNDTISNTGSVTSSIRGDDTINGDGGNDQITNSGYASNLFGDSVFNGNAGGDDTILNTVEGTALFISGDLISIAQDDMTVYGGDDQITNHGITSAEIAGDDIFDDYLVTANTVVHGGNDTILNTGQTGMIYGDKLFHSQGDNTITMFAGEDIITNTGTVTIDIYGDGLGDDNNPDYDVNPSGAGASDTITNSGTVGGTIFAEGGDDTVILRDGANGGDDNNLPLDGGDGTDTLIFEFSNLDQSTIDAINASDPANDSITIDGETFTWTNFEAIQVNSSCSGGVATVAELITAIDTANSNNQPDTINLAPNCLFLLTETLIIEDDGVGNTLTINGNDAILDGAYTIGLFTLNTGAELTFSEITLRRGGGVSGGAINNLGGTLIISQSNFFDNEADGVGGAIQNIQSGVVNISTSQFIGNYADVCGAIRNADSGVMTISESLFSEHHGADSATICNSGATIDVIATTLTNNQSAWLGGTLSNSTTDSTMTVTNSTIAYNNLDPDMTDFRGGGIINSGTLNVYDSTIAYNGNANITQGGGIYTASGGGTVNLRNTIVYGNTAQSGADIYGTVNSLDHNLIGDITDATINGQTANNLIGVDPLLGALQDNGGMTETMALGAGSSAIDMGSCNVAVDQRGEPRPAGSDCDIGAFEDQSGLICPDGTAGDDTIVCQADPPTGTNTNDSIEGGAGIDDITVNAGVTVNEIFGDSIIGSSGANHNGHGDDDTIINNGTVSLGITGDAVTGDGGDDTIINNNSVNVMIGDDSVGVGGDDIITNNGDAHWIMGDGISNNDGGDDIITNTTGSSVDIIDGDLISISESGVIHFGDDIITNEIGATAIIISADSSSSGGGGLSGDIYAGNDTIINHGTVMQFEGTNGDVYGDHINTTDYTLHDGNDTILNTGTVEGDIFGDYITDSNAPLDSQGGDDQITNSGTVGGSIFAGAGDDVVILQDGANGGADNNLPLDGGLGYDVLFFDFTNLDQSTINAINASDPANGSVVINGETFTWTNFEALALDDLCPDGTAGDDTIVCQANPPTGTNTDDGVEGGTGIDDITINNGVTVHSVTGDGDIGNSGSSYNGDGSDDIITNNGDVQGIMGDDVFNGDGGDDIIINNGNSEFFIIGDGVTVGNGGDDLITNNGDALWIFGDDVEEGNGGDDTIILTSGSTTVDVQGDYLDAFFADNTTLFAGNDQIEVNLGATVNQISGDSIHIPAAPTNLVFYSGDDVIINDGFIESVAVEDTISGGTIYGDYIIDHTTNSAFAGEDIITNTGVISADIYGDYIVTSSEDAEPTGEGASDIITNAGTVGGSIFAEGGDDLVTLQDGANGGADNNLPLDGGLGYDVLFFDFTNLDQSTINAINASDPANGSVVIGGETFTWTNFEALALDDLCPDGMAGDDILVCQANPPTGTNTDDNIDAGAGIDHITINAGVTVSNVHGDGTVGNPNHFYDGNGSNDTIINNGHANFLIGDLVNGDGGDDTIINSGTTNNVITGDSVFNGNGGDDTIHNLGYIVLGIWGDDIVGHEDNITYYGGNDTLTNDGTSGALNGDDINISNASNATAIGGDDYIINNGTLSSSGIGIYGDDIYIDIDDYHVTAGQDMIINQGRVNGDIYGDYITYSDNFSGLPRFITGQGASDTITNSGTVGGTIFAEGGDDLVTLQNGANGGADNNLPLDGGSGFDTLDFAFTGMSQATKDLIDSADPANGSITIGGQTFTWTNFEALTTSNFVVEPMPPTQPDGLSFSGDLTTPPVQPTYTWNHDGQATWYYVQLNRGATVVFQTWFEVGVDVVCDVICSITPAVSLVNGEHTWWVQGYNALGTSAWSDGYIFNVDIPAPNIPVNLTISGSLTEPPVQPTYQWDNDPNVTWYQLYVSNGGAVIDTWYQTGVDIICDSTCSITPEVPLSNGEYSWWVLAYNSVGTVWSNEDATFTVAIPAPNIPTGLTTSGSLTVPPVQPTYEWTHDPNTTWYQLQVNNSSGAVIQSWYEVGNDITCSATCTINPAVTLANGNYTWWVNAYNSIGSVWSNGANFSVNAPAPIMPTGLNTSGAPAQPTYEWTHDPNTTWYELYVSNGAGAVIDVWYEVGNGITCSATCSITPSTALANGNYTWWVNAYNSVGNVWSDGANFSVNLPAPVQPTNLSINAPSTLPTYEWTHDPNTTWYQLQVNNASGVVIQTWLEVGVDVTCSATCSLVSPTILSSGNHSWWVQGYNSVGTSAWSDTAAFTVP